jgi:hypothetical protein
MWIALAGIGTWSAVMIFVVLLMATIKERHRMEEEAIEDYERRKLWGETHGQWNRIRLANIHTSSRRPNPGKHPPTSP